jgi:serine/threonine protein kinase, bacterial
LEGTLLDGRYLVQSKIGSGGTSTVYRGVDVRLDRPVALKVMDSRYAGDDQFLTRFQLEARSVARLKNPGLLAVYDQGLDSRHPFLVMELVEGGTLRELLTERGPMPPHAVVAVLRPVLGGLGAAHRAGLVHRDVKPENVLISDDGDVKIADFGLVRAVAAAGITSASVILGTAAYLSPEQVRDGNAGPRSDVYSTGILTYELLTGRTPFTGDSTLSIAYHRCAAPRRGDRRRATAIRRIRAAGDGARLGRPIRRRARDGRRIGRDRRRTRPARLPGAGAA